MENICYPLALTPNFRRGALIHIDRSLQLLGIPGFPSYLHR